MRGRYRARRLALQGLCCLDVQGEKAMDQAQSFLTDSHETPETIRAADALMRETWADRDVCDALVARHSRHWELGRLAMVDRNVLRLAVHEIRTGRTPFKVAIAEAIKLVGEFSTADSPRFVNGILDAVGKSLGADAGGDGHGPAGGAGRPRRRGRPPGPGGD